MTLTAQIMKIVTLPSYHIAVYLQKTLQLMTINKKSIAIPQQKYCLEAHHRYFSIFPGLSMNLW